MCLLRGGQSLFLRGRRGIPLRRDLGVCGRGRVEWDESGMRVRREKERVDERE